MNDRQQLEQETISNAKIRPTIKHIAQTINSRSKAGLTYAFICQNIVFYVDGEFLLAATVNKTYTERYYADHYLYINDKMEEWKTVIYPFFCDLLDIRPMEF